MKIGLIYITKAYIGNKQLTEQNAYVGTYKVIDGEGPEPIVYDGLTFTAEEANSTVTYHKSAAATAEYSFDTVNWNDAEGVELTLADVGDKVYFRGNITDNQSEDSGSYALFTMTGKIAASGNVNSLNGGSDTFMYNYTYYKLFNNCTSLTKAPELPATTLAMHCYDSMFRGCSSLTTAPALPATSLSYCCYRSMFERCSSLTTAPELPATTLANYCYRGMFYKCSSLTTAPALPATTLADSCYYLMFEGCSSLITAPELPATTLAMYCYLSMFNECTALVNAPALPATALSYCCYYLMFEGCSSLITAPELPATTLLKNCYSNMFNGCTSLVNAPELPATTLANYCYYLMFNGCTNLSRVVCKATKISATSCLDNWLNGVSATGDFYKVSTVTYPDGVSGIPSTWTVHTELD